MNFSEPELIATNCSSLTLNNSTITVTVNSITKDNLVPKLFLEFADDFHLCYFEQTYIKNTILQLYKYVYLCGDGIEFKNDENSIKIFSFDGSSGYDDSDEDNRVIRIYEKISSPAVVLHEILHAIYDINSEVPEHNIQDNICSLRDIYTDGAPGLMMDIVSRLQMNYTTNQLGFLGHKLYYLGIDLYPSLNFICPDTLVQPFDSSPITKNIDRIKKDKPRNTDLIKKEEFLALKFGDEYNVLSTISGFPKFLNKEAYVTLNLENYFKK